MATKARQQYHADEVTLSKERREFSISDDVQEKIEGIEEGAQVNTIETIRVNGNEVQPDENKAIDLTIPGVIDSLSSTSITDALSARQGKILYDKIDNVSRIGHFLALWDASTGLPVTDPETSPYEYHAGDFYIISVVASQGGTNYKPSGTEYISGQASTDVEVDDVEVNDFYFYDGQVWRHMKNSGAGDVVVDGSLSTTSRNPVENRVITNALSGKQNTLTAGANIQISGNTISATDTKYTAGTGISIVNGVISNTQTSAEWGNITGTLSDQTDLQTVLTSKATDADVVHKTGAETIAGTKTFSTSPVVPSKTTAATNTGTAIATEAQVYKKQDTLVVGKGISIGDITINGRKGPSPDGFHVPSTTEWQGLNTIMTSLSLTTGDGWRINLHMPFAGYRNYSDASLSNQRSRGYYWSSSPFSATSSKAYCLPLSSSSVNAGSSIGRAYGVSVRCFKNEYITPTSSWTVVQGTLGSAGIFWNQSEGLISITDGSTGYTIMDKNLGATTVYNDGDTLTQENMGNMYQWGNNYGFPSTGTISKTSSTLIDASAYGPTNPYSSDTFITGSTEWSSVGNSDLWGDTTGTITQENVISNTGVLSVNGQTGDVTISTPEESNTKTFYLSSTSDLTNAQAAVDWLIAGKNPIVKYAGYSYICTAFDSQTSLLLTCTDYDAAIDNSSVTKIKAKALDFSLNSNNEVTAISMGEDRVTRCLSTDINYPTPYVPQYDGSPATKKYVDDNINTKTFYLSNTSDLTNAQAAVDWFLSGKNPIIYYSGAAYSYAGQIIFEDNKNGYRFVASAGVVGGSPSGQGVTPSSVENFVISLKVDSSNTVTNIYSETLDVDVLPAFSSSEVVYTPINSWDPATKKYVDDNVVQKSATAPSNPTEGMLWYDTTNDILKAYNGTQWNAVDTNTTYNAGEGIEIGTYNDYSAMRGPCPKGFHIMTKAEGTNLINAFKGLGLNGTASFRQYFKVPTTGQIIGTTGQIGQSTTIAEFRLSEISTTTGKPMVFEASKSYALACGGTTIDSCSIRPYKDVPVAPDNSWTTLYDGSSTSTGAGIFHNSTLGLISISLDGTNWITIADKNLGATVVYNEGDAVSEINAGKLYQWGNNYGFPLTGATTTSSTKVDTTGYGPGNYYTSSTFITVSNNNEFWTNPSNPNLRGGVTGVVQLDNAITNTGVLSVNGQTGDVTISTPEESNTKTFYLSGTSDLTTAQAAYDWYLAGKNPVIVYDNKVYTFYSKTTTRLSFSSIISNNVGNSTTSVILPSIYLGLSSDTVTSISTQDRTMMSGLGTTTNYSTPYTPMYNGSPATKKYVDDNIKTYTAGTGIIIANNVISNTGVTSVNGQTGAVTVNDVKKYQELPTSMEAGVVFYSLDDGKIWYSQGGGSYARVGNFYPSNSGTTGQVLTKTSSGYNWATPVAGLQKASNSPLDIQYFWAGTQAQYDALSSYSDDTVYLTI